MGALELAALVLGIISKALALGEQAQDDKDAQHAAKVARLKAADAALDGRAADAHAALEEEPKKMAAAVEALNKP
jgi:hypothetical protein